MSPLVRNQKLVFILSGAGCFLTLVLLLLCLDVLRSDETSFASIVPSRKTHENNLSAVSTQVNRAERTAGSVEYHVSTLPDGLGNSDPEKSGGGVNSAGNMVNSQNPSVAQSSPLTGSELTTLSRMDQNLVSGNERSSQSPRSGEVSRSTKNISSSSDGIAQTNSNDTTNEDASSGRVILEEPLFYKVDQAELSKLPPEAQQAVAGMQQSYVDFYNEWRNNFPNNPRTWNDQMKKFHREMILKLGARQVDNILR